MAANDRQVGGDHYTVATGKCPSCGGTIQHWDLYGHQPYLVGQVTKYVTRQKNGLQDVLKALHFLEKYAASQYGVDLLVEYASEGKSQKIPKVSKHVAAAKTKDPHG